MSADAFASLAERMLGAPYREQGTDPRGFSCTGLVSYVGRAFGLIPSGDHWTEEKMAEAWGRFMVDDAPARGDVLIFGRDGLTHAAIAVSSWQMVEASNGGADPGVRYRPIGHRKDLRHVVRLYR